MAAPGFVAVIEGIPKVYPSIGSVLSRDPQITIALRPGAGSRRVGIPRIGRAPDSDHPTSP